MQAALARLFTDDELRALLARDPHAAARKMRLTAEETAYLRRLDQEQLERFAQTLKRKRKPAQAIHDSAADRAARSYRAVTRRVRTTFSISFRP